MGVHNTDNGISTQLVKANGDPDGISVYYQFAALFGAPQTTVVGAGGLTQNETLHPGSDDWLTVVALADTRAKLDAILQYPAIAAAPQGPFQTSGSSYRVLLVMHKDDDKQSLIDRITIAEGKTSTNPPKMELVSLKILPPETVLNDQHPLTGLFDRQGRFR